jgi:hypothetical protein
MYFDFHSKDSALPDYSTRIQSVGGATTGTGNLNMYASTIGLMGTNGVGIGTTVPSAALHLITAPTANGIINVSNSTTLSSTASSQDILQRWVQNTNNTSILDLSLVRVSVGSDWTTSAQRFQSKIDATWQAYMQFYNYGIQFGAGSSNTSANSIPVAMTIISGGNVGIGTTNPQTTLHVNGGIKTGIIYTYSASIASLASGTNTTTNLIPLNSTGVYLLTITGFDGTSSYKKLSGTAIVTMYFDGGTYYYSALNTITTNYVTFVSITTQGVITFNQTAGGTASISITALCIG